MLLVDGKVIDANGKVVGRVGLDGRAVGINSEVLGEVATALVDKDGKVQASVDKVIARC